MSAIMVVCMQMHDAGWTRDYFAKVPALLAEHGGKQLSGSRSIEVIEGDLAPPDRIALFEFPDAGAAHHFMEDARYRPFLLARRAGSRSQIYLFENMAGEGTLT